MGRGWSFSPDGAHAAPQWRCNVMITRDGAAVASLAAVAKAAGVSAMTVSRVLRHSPRVRERTRRRVEAAVRRTGYRPDPQIARLMAKVREGRRRRSGSVIAVVRDDLPDDDLHDRAYQYVSVADVRGRAAQHGYLVEQFSLGPQITARRLGQVLRARGIEGMIVSPQSSRRIVADLDYAPFAAATFGYGLQYPALHRASTNMTRGILQAMDELTQRGYRRIGLAITEWVDARSEHTYSGALLRFQQSLPPRERVPMLLFPQNAIAPHAASFCSWVQRHRPDALISFDAYVPEWLERRLGLRIPQDVGLVVHDWVARMTGLAGIDHRRAHVAAAAVDLVASQLFHNERGIPEVPRQILIPPAWVSGASIRSLPRRRG